MAKFEQYKDGIYFDLDEDIYHGQERLSSTAIKRGLVSMATLWANSWLNPEREEDEELTPDQMKVRNLGKAYHCARLEPHALHDRFVGEPDYKALKGILTNATQIEAKLEAYGKTKKQKGEKVLDQARRLISYGYTGHILHIEKDEFAETVKGRIVIEGKVWQQLLRDMERIKKNPEISSLLSGGYAEVSILWTCPETGLKLKARLDYLKRKLFTDFKSFANPRSKPLAQALLDAFTYDRYYLQGTFYWEATEAIRTGIVENVVGTDEQIAFIEDIRKNEVPLRPWFVFQEKKGVPNLLAYHLKMYKSEIHNESGWEDLSGSVTYDKDEVERLAWQHKMQSSIGMKATVEIAHVKKEFLRNCEIFETGEEWFTKDPIRVLRDHDFNSYWLERMPT